MSIVEGISETSFLYIVSEIGTDMRKWPNSKCFTAWLNLAPNTKITGGKIISSKMQKKKNHAGQAFRLAANSLKNSNSPLGNYARKMKSRLGIKAGNVATAHKLSKIIYSMLKNKSLYDSQMLIRPQQELTDKKIAFLEKQLRRLKQAS